MSRGILNPYFYRLYLEKNRYPLPPVLKTRVIVSVLVLTTKSLLKNETYV